MIMISHENISAEKTEVPHSQSLNESMAEVTLEPRSLNLHLNLTSPLCPLDKCCLFSIV